MKNLGISGFNDQRRIANMTSAGEPTKDRTPLTEQESAYLRHVHEQLLSLHSNMEDMRWKFITALGVLAAAGIGVVGINTFSSPLRVLAACISFGVCCAALICLSRVYAMAVTLWNRMRECEELQARSLPHPTKYQAICLYRIDSRRPYFDYWLTVSHSISVVFSLMLTSSVLLFSEMLAPKFLTLLTGAPIGFAIFVGVDYTHYRISNYLASRTDINVGTLDSDALRTTKSK